jgi:uncharacterized protein (TIGR02246 family)
LRHRAAVRIPHAMKIEDEIRQAIDRRVEAVRRKDVNGLLALYAREVLTFDLVVPLRNAGVDAVRRRVESWFASFRTAIEYELRDVRIAGSGDLAYDHHLVHVRGTTHTGNAVDMWFRETVGYERRAGVWLVTHQHSSVPIDMTNGRGVLDLQP